MNKVQITIAIFVLSIGVLSVASRISNNEKGVVVMKAVNNFDVECKEIDRKLTKEDLLIIEFGSSFESIEVQIGEPNGWIGSGVLAPYYCVGKEKYAIFRFNNPFIYEDLRQIDIVNDTTVLEVIKCAPQQ